MGACGRRPEVPLNLLNHGPVSQRTAEAAGDTTNVANAGTHYPAGRGHGPLRLGNRPWHRPGVPALIAGPFVISECPGHAHTVNGTPACDGFKTDRNRWVRWRRYGRKA